MGSPFVVYVQGYGRQDFLWYRMEFENKIKRERVKFERVAQLDRMEGGAGGGWAVIGEDGDIYWVAGSTNYGEGTRIYTNLDVFKHKCSSNPDQPTAWVKVSSRKIPRVSPFVAAVSGGKKLCVVSGYEHYLPKPTSDEEAALSVDDHWNCYDWSKAGEIYDPDTDSWTYLEAPMEPFRDYRPTTAALALDKDEILFNRRGSYGLVLFCDLGKDVYIADPMYFDSWFCEAECFPPPGLEDCDDLDILEMCSRNSTPVVLNDTFYWFTYDLRLFGYDMNRQVWFRSPSLAHKLDPLKPPTKPIMVYPPTSILLGLPNGELLVIVEEDDVPGTPDARYLTLASLSVVRDGVHTVDVSVSFLQPFSVDDPSFVLCDGKAV